MEMNQFHGGDLDGKQVVYDCPCNLASQYEKLFWQSRYVIQNYFSNRAETRAKRAQETAEIARDVSKAVDAQ